jgi:hypothetical protein
VLLLAWLLVPSLLALIESAFGQSIFQARYLLVSLPAVALVLAWTGVRALPELLSADRLRSRPHLLALALFVTLLTLRALQLGPSYGYSFENWRAATASVLAGAKAGDCLAFYPSDGRQAFKYYLGDRSTELRPILPQTPLSEVRSYVEDYASLSPSQLAELRSRCGRVWLVSRNQDRVGGPPATNADHARFIALQNNLEARYPRVQRQSFGYGNSVVVGLFGR